MSDPVLSATFLQDHHRYHNDDVELDLGRFKEERDGSVRCEITLSTDFGSVGRVAGPARLNLLSDRSIKTLANTCSSVVDTLPWYDWISHAAATSVERIRTGDPLQLVDADTPSTQRQWILEPFLEDSGYTVLFARGGSAKSYLAAALALCIATDNPALGEVHRPGPVAYLDWEDSKQEFDSRITRLARGLNTPHPQVWYRYFDGISLTAAAPSLTHQLADHDVVAAIVDSKGMALTGSPESSEAVLELVRAIRTLNVPVLLVDHVSKGQIKGDDPDMAFGSAYTEYGARLAWSLNSDWHTGYVDLRLKNTKANHGPRNQPTIITLTFAGDTVHLSRDTRTPQPDQTELALLAGLTDRRDLQ